MVADAIDGEPSTASPADRERSRRQLLSAGGTAALGGALFLSGCTSKVKQASHVPITRDTPGVGHDIRALNLLLDLEYRAIAAYTESIPLLPQPAPPPTNQSPPPPATTQPSNAPPPPLRLLVPLAYTAAQTFQTHELAHVRELSGLIRQAGGQPRKPAAFYDLGPEPRGRTDVLRLLHRTEEKVIAEYLKVVDLLTPEQLRGAVAAILANHAQHSSVIRLELGLAPIPSAFLSRPE